MSEFIEANSFKLSASPLKWHNFQLLRKSLTILYQISLQDWL